MACLGFDHWVTEEFYGINFDDVRLNDRFIKTAYFMAENPNGSILGTCGDISHAKGAYRMFDNEKVNVREILATHQARTVERVTKTSSVILAIQDTCFLNFNEKLTTEGLGHIGSNQTSHHQGLIMHTTFAFDPVEQTALGIIDQDIWARKKEPIRLTARQRKLLPIEQKESIKWLKALRATHEALVDSNKQVVTLADREADIFEFLQEAAHLHQNYVIRAVRNRKILTCDGNSLIWEELLKQKVAGELDLDIPAKAGHKKRTARLEVRFCPLLIKPTQERPEIRNVAPVQVYGILVKEKNRPEGDALEWMLLTNLKVESFEQAVEKAAWYKCRVHHHSSPHFQNKPSRLD